MAPSAMTAMMRGLHGRCPDCGEGRIYRAYLKVNEHCPACGHDLGRYRTDDGPAYFTIVLVGHLVIAPLLFLPFIWRSPVAIVLPVTVIPLVVLTLLLLPRVKGAFLGLLLALKTTGEHAPGSELAASEPGPKPRA